MGKGIDEQWPVVSCYFLWGDEHTGAVAHLPFSISNFLNPD